MSLLQIEHNRKTSSLEEQLIRQLETISLTLDQKNHATENLEFIKKIKAFLNDWKSDWHLVYLQLPSPLPAAPFIFSFFGKPIKDTQKLCSFFDSWSMYPDDYYYNDLLSPELDFRYKETFLKYEPIIFLRNDPEKGLKIEINQKVIHCSNLFFSEVNQSYRRQNENGECEDLVFINEDRNFAFVLMHKMILETYMHGSKTSLIKMFDFMTGVSPQGREHERLDQPIINDKDQFFAKSTRLVFHDNSAFQYCRGGEIISPTISKKEAKQFAFNECTAPDLEFWAKNRITNKFELKSCKVDDQHYLDPVFFNAEVLNKYIGHPSKYELNVEEGKLFCKIGGWLLRSCYEASDNQMYCYLGDLSFLPHKEQLHWQAHNLKFSVTKESCTAIKKDFFGEWVEEEWGKNRLERILQNYPCLIIDKQRLEIWVPKENFKDMVISLHVPIVKEYEQYRTFLGALARLTTEGFQKNSLELWAKYLNISFDKSIGSIILLKRCLVSLTEINFANEVIIPLKELHDIKASTASHGGAKKISNDEIIPKSQKLLRDVTWAMEKLSAFLSSRNSSLHSCNDLHL